MGLFAKTIKAPTPEEQKEPERIANASDDLMTRSENIVWCLGFRGSVGDYVLAVYRILQIYERFDKNHPPDTPL